MRKYLRGWRSGRRPLAVAAFVSVAVVVAAVVGGTIAVRDARDGASAISSDRVHPYIYSTGVVSAPAGFDYGAAIPAAPAEPPPPPPSRDLAISFDALQRDSGAAIGMVVVPVGNVGSPVQLGNWSADEPAWSTMKVPLAIAALRSGSADSALIRDAITQSDNAAAERLWSELGDPETAATAVEAVMSQAGDPTQVQSQRVRAEYTSFGQTRWPLTQQAGFLASAVCNPDNEVVLSLMGQISPGQQWGLGLLAGSRFKGGWGPSPQGSYLVRQFGIVETGLGSSAVAVSATPSSGTFDDGVSALDATAEWLAAHSDAVGGGRCN